MKVIKNNILVIILILIVLISIAVYGILPTRLPIHFTLTGTVDGTAPKLEGISFMLVMELILWLISSFGIKDINLKKVIDGIGIILFLAQLAIIGIALKPTANINMINAVALSCMIIIIALMTIWWKSPYSSEGMDSLSLGLVESYFLYALYFWSLIYLSTTSLLMLPREPR